MRLSLTPLPGLPAEIEPGDDLAALIVAAARKVEPPLAAETRVGPPATEPFLAGDVLAVAHKAVSKAEGRLRDLRQVKPGRDAAALAQVHDKDPRHVQVVLDESRELLRAQRGVLICVTHHGFVCANAGVDASNVAGEDTVVLLPQDPDHSARRLRQRLRELTGVAPAVIITDSFGRAWRVGQSDVAIGCAGVSPLSDWRGSRDAHGRELKATHIATADELAGAADAARRKDAGEAVVLIRGAAAHVTAEDGPGAVALVRPEPDDLFR